MSNIITIFVVVIMTELVLFSTQQQYTYAQIPGLPGSDNSNNPSENTASETATNNTTNSYFVTYHSDIFGYTIQYPSDWSVHEYERLNSVVISSPDKHAQASFSIDVRQPEKFLDTNDLQVKIKTPHDLVIDRINNMRQQTPQTTTIEYDSYLRDKSVTIAGNSAWQLESTFVTLILGVKQFYKIEYYISMPSNDGRVMLVSFSVDQLDVPTYLPIAQQVIHSIQLA